MGLDKKSLHTFLMQNRFSEYYIFQDEAPENCGTTFKPLVIHIYISKFDDMEKISQVVRIL